ncbi:MAG TPA: hypothetical protein VM940_06750 [Chthoniobacterales bacterium]|jgi:hypothetical protein|nr:hypothetical protein [Chthoniobacterales bacterium]
MKFPFRIFRRRKFPVTAGMISRQEQAWFRNYAAKLYTGRGAIVDLGCFVGSTTICLAQGLEMSAAAKGAKIHAYDQFVWDADFAQWWTAQNLPEPAVTENSFLPEFLKRTAPFSDRIVLHQEDLAQTRWENGPIEFLLVDAMKSPALAHKIALTFFSALTPGTSYLAHQDFAHVYTPWIHLLQYRLRVCFSLAADIPRSASVVFKCEKQVRLESVAPLIFDSPAEIEATFDYSLTLVSDDKKPSIVAAHAFAWFERGEFRRAQQVVEANPWGSASLSGELEMITDLIRQKLGGG